MLKLKYELYIREGMSKEEALNKIFEEAERTIKAQDELLAEYVVKYSTNTDKEI